MSMTLNPINKKSQICTAKFPIDMLTSNAPLPTKSEHERKYSSMLEIIAVNLQLYLNILRGYETSGFIADC